jgi:membrane protease YdiL (CAAX protease family)
LRPPILKNIISIRRIKNFLLIRLNYIRQSKLFNNPVLKKVVYYSMIITSILTFAKLHSNPDNFVGFSLSYFLPYIIAGIVFTVVRLMFSLKASIILHMLNNTLALLIPYHTLLTPIADKVSLVLFIIALIELVIFYKLTKITKNPKPISLNIEKI